MYTKPMRVFRVSCVFFGLFLVSSCETSMRSGQKKSKKQDQVSGQTAPQSGAQQQQQQQNPQFFPDQTNPNAIQQNSPSPGNIAPNPNAIGIFDQSLNPPNAIGLQQPDKPQINQGLPQSPGPLAGPGGDTPLVLDLDQDGKIKTLSGKSSVRFDINADGHKERIDWIHPQDGFLAIDLNGNSKIDSARELFGNATWMMNRNIHDGFRALAKYDQDHNLVIDQNDSVYRKLLVWQDHNADGISQKSELRSLEKLKIDSISVRLFGLKKKLDGKVLSFGSQPTESIARVFSLRTSSSTTTKNQKRLLKAKLKEV